MPVTRGSLKRKQAEIQNDEDRVTVTLDLSTAHCSICKDLVRQPVSNFCGHTFCRICLDEANPWRCPVCREKMRTGPNLMLRALLEQIDAYNEHAFESSLDGQKKKLEEKWGTIQHYDTNYAEQTQCSILFRLREQAEFGEVPKIFHKGCFVIAIKGQTKDKDSTVSIAVNRAGYFMLLDTGTHFFLLQQQKHDEENPFRREES